MGGAEGGGQASEQVVTPGPAPPWAWGKDRPQQEGKQGPSPKSDRTRSLAQGQQRSTGQTHVERERERDRPGGLDTARLAQDVLARARAMHLCLEKSVRICPEWLWGQGPQPDFALCVSYTSIELLLSTQFL